MLELKTELYFTYRSGSNSFLLVKNRNEFLCLDFKGHYYLHMIIMNDKLNMKVSSSLTRLRKTKSNLAPKHSC